MWLRQDKNMADGGKKWTATLILIRDDAVANFKWHIVVYDCSQDTYHFPDFNRVPKYRQRNINASEVPTNNFEL